MRTAATILFGLILGLVLGESLVRIYFAVTPDPKGSPYIKDRYAVYRLRPDPPEVFRRDPDGYTNSLGFRDREHSRLKPPHTYRILGIGDSFVYANIHHLSDNFLKVAETTAARRCTDSLSVEMVLMGVGGYSPENEVAVLRSIGLPLDPDLVVLNFFVGNDVTGIPLRGKILGGQWYPAGSPYPWLNLLRKSDAFLLAEKNLLPPFRGALLRLYLHTRGKRSRPAPEPVAQAGRADGRERTAPSDWYLHALLKDMPVFAAHPDRRTTRLWGEAEGYLLEFDRLCAQKGIPWILVLIPAHIQVDPELRRIVFDRFALSADDWDFDAPQRRLHAFAAAHAISTVDPLPPLRELMRPDSILYLPNDGHWNVRGNRIAGEMLGAVIGARLRPASLRASSGISPQPLPGVPPARP